MCSSSASTPSRNCIATKVEGPRRSGAFLFALTHLLELAPSALRAEQNYLVGPLRSSVRLSCKGGPLGPLNPSTSRP